MKKTDKNKSMGINVPLPSKECQDKACPFHGKIQVRGRTFVGEVISSFQKSATIKWERRVFLPKYERYEKRWSKVHAHNPSCINAKVGDMVKIAECRPISKTKSFVIIQNLK